MSNAESQNASQTPAQEALDRALEQLPGLGLARLVGVEHLRAVLGAARGRVNDDHQLKKEVLRSVASEGGLAAKENPAGEGEDVGGISVAGDSTTTINITGTPTAPTSGGAGRVLKKCLPYAATALIAGATGVGVPWMLGLFSKAPAAVQQVIPDWQLGLEVKDQP